ncbi:unnamed protein product [marine sediment metagenome]|uniref:Uncharacterized protein n=1 Tax=marine sediment metagenome TaxID=412755 RepID=X1M0R5_9ZZZZ
MPNKALIRFSKEFDIPLDSPELLPKLISEITKLKKELQEKDM